VFGKSTLGVSLPKKWVIKTSVKASAEKTFEKKLQSNRGVQIET